MPTFYRDEMDVRDEIAEGIFVGLIADNFHGDHAAIARQSYNAAEAFIEERAKRRKADRDADRTRNDDDDPEDGGGW